MVPCTPQMRASRMGNNPAKTLQRPGVYLKVSLLLLLSKNHFKTFTTCFAPRNEGVSRGFRGSEMRVGLGGTSKARRKQLVKVPSDCLSKSQPSGRNSRL